MSPSRRLLPALALALVWVVAAPAGAAGAAGGRVVFSVWVDQSQPRIAVMDADGTQKTLLTDPGPEDLDEDPSWSPDGTQIVFARGLQDPETGNFSRDLYVVGADGTGLTQLTDTPSLDERDPDWSPDGLKVVFQSFGDGDGGSVWSMKLDGTERTRLSTARDANPVWSPDGTTVAFSRNSVIPDDLFLVSADGTEESQLTFDDPSAEDRFPAWSPDGTRLAFHRELENGIGDERDPELMVRDMSDGSLQQITTNTLFDTEPSWSPDGAELIYLSQVCTTESCHRDLFVMDAAGGSPTNITNTADEGESSPDWWGPSGPADADDDGIGDAIDADPTGTSGAFSDGGTSGTVVDRAGLVVTVEDLPAPDGVRVVIGAGTGWATIQVCGFTVRLDGGSTADLTCGSILLHAVTEPAQIVLNGGRTVVTVAEGSTARVSETDGGRQLVESISGVVTLTTGGRTRDVPPGGSATAPPAGPCGTPAGLKMPAPAKLCAS